MHTPRRQLIQLLQILCALKKKTKFPAEKYRPQPSENALLTAPYSLCEINNPRALRSNPAEFARRLKYEKSNITSTATRFR